MTEPPDVPMTTVYVSIGNSDDRLTQAEWSTFADEVAYTVEIASSVVHGVWYSAPDSPYQNACICAEIPGTAMDRLRQDLADICADHRQESIALAIANTEFITPTTLEGTEA